MTTALVSLLPTLPLPIDVSLPLDARALGFTLALSLVAAVLSGLAPAFHGSKAEVVGGLKADAQGGPERLRLRNAFVISQVAFSIVLVVGAGLFVRALQRASSIDPGFDPGGVELAFLDLSLSGYTETTGPAFAQQLVERVRTLPGVRDATMSAHDAARDEPDGPGRPVAAGRADTGSGPAGSAASGLAQGGLERGRTGLFQDHEDAARQRPRLHGRRSAWRTMGGDRQRDGGATDVAQSVAARQGAGASRRSPRHGRLAPSDDGDRRGEGRQVRVAWRGHDRVRLRADAAAVPAAYRRSSRAPPTAAGLPPTSGRSWRR